MCDLIQCPQCNGGGQVPLPDPHADTLAILREHGPSTPSFVHDMTKKRVGITAINNRLVDLLQWGFVERWKNVKDPKQWIYRAKA